MKVLMYSSFLFIIPSIYAFIKAYYFHCFMLIFTSIVSANYWRNAIHSWRRNADLVVSKIAFTVYVYNGIIYIRWFPFVITGYSGLAILLYCFYLSNLRFREKNDNWYKYHVAFHCIMTYEQLIILLSM
jgi:hypothetical protein